MLAHSEPEGSWITSAAPLRERDAVFCWHRRWTPLILIIAWSIALVAQQSPDADTVLQRARDRLLADIDRMPRYTCVQTITRRYYRAHTTGASCVKLMADHKVRPDKNLLRGWDRLRLEVAIVNGDIVYSWVGAPRFETSTLEQLAGRGPFSTGDFGPFLNSIFTRASVIFKNEDLRGQQRLLAYAFDVPVDRSTYQIKTDNRWIPTAYSGTFLLDPIAADIAGLTVRTAELPENNPDCQAISEVEYGRTEIHDRMVLIPRQTSLVTINRDGSETHSLTTYAACREYASTTRLLLDGSAPSSSPAAIPRVSQPELSAVPAGLRLRARIVSTIDSDTAAAGDPVEAVLLYPIRDKNKRELAPRGAHLHGRLLALEQHSGFLDYFRVSIEFESIDLVGRTVPLRAVPDLALMSSGVSVFRSQLTVLSDSVAPDTAAFVFRLQHLHLEKFDWAWTTLPVSGRNDNRGMH